MPLVLILEAKRNKLLPFIFSKDCKNLVLKNTQMYFLIFFLVLKLVDSKSLETEVQL